MDPLTHGLIGIGLTVFTGERFSIGNPLHMGAFLGALAPDFDIVLQLFGDISYLKHHRGFSHSIPGVVLFSGLLSLMIWGLYSGVFISIFLWTLLGAFSHIIMDLFNSYGAKLLWPYSRKNHTFNLLVLADPVVIGLFAVSILWPGPLREKGIITLLVLFCYLSLRFLFRQWVIRRIKLIYKDTDLDQVIVMPAMVSIWNWTFLIESKDQYIIGEYKFFNAKLGEKRVLFKTAVNEVVEKAERSKLGRLFCAFTPYFHMNHTIEDGKHVVHFCDLRYFFKEDFLHNATITFDEAHNIIEAVFQPYSKKKKIEISG